MKYTKTEKAAIIASLKRVAVAYAEFWDVTRSIEVSRSNVEIDTDHDAVSTLAAETCHPPQETHLSDSFVWEVFQGHTTVKSLEPSQLGQKEKNK